MPTEAEYVPRFEYNALLQEIERLRKSQRQCMDCPGGKDWEDEAERLRAAAKEYQREIAVFMERQARLHRIEEAAKLVATLRTHTDEFYAALKTLRAALEEKP